MYKDRRDQSEGVKAERRFPADGTGSRSEMPALQQLAGAAPTFLHAKRRRMSEVAIALPSDRVASRESLVRSR